MSVGRSTLNGVASTVRAFVLVSFDREAVLLGAVVDGSIIAEKPEQGCNAVHLSGAALRSTGNRVFEIFTVLGLEGLGR